MTGPGNGEEYEELTPVEVIQAFCDLEPTDAWDAFRAVARDPLQPEERRIRAGAWLAR